MIAATVGVIVALALAVASSGDAADSRPTPRASAVMQYAELVPTARGPVAPGVDTRASSPPPASRAVGASSAAFAKALAELATSSDYGAPSSTTNGSAQPLETGSDFNGALRTAAAAAIDVGDARLVGLFAVMVVILVGAAALAVDRRRL